MGRLCRNTCSYVCPQTWFNEARTNIDLSPTMDFLNENDSLAYFAILRELSSGLSGLFQNLKFPFIISWLFQGQGRIYLATPLCFSWLKKTKYQKRNFFGFLH